MTNFLFFVRDERDIGFETTWQLGQNRGGISNKVFENDESSVLAGENRMYDIK